MNSQTMTNIDLLSPEECHQIHNTVLHLQNFWENRIPTIPFYTLGAASYLDASPSQAAYLHKAQKYNQILSVHLDYFYEQLSSALTKYLMAPIAYPSHLALPGFHIYQSCKLFEQAIASIHFDLQYQLIDWQIDGENSPDRPNPISFTIAIALPKYGGGLNTWQINYNETFSKELNNLIASRPQSFHAYEIGKLFIHSGHMLHQVAPAINIQPNDERITIQGHGLFCQGSWQIYW